MLWQGEGCQAAHAASHLQVLAPCVFGEGPSPASGTWFPFAHAPLCSPIPIPGHTRAEVHLGLSSFGPPNHAGKAWITLCPIQDPCLLLAMLFCKHELQQMLFHCSSNQCSLGREEDTGG